MIAAKFGELIRTKTNLYAPLGYGGHVDHRLTRFAAESSAVPLHYYHDQPYSGQGLPIPEDLGTPSGSGLVRPLSQDDVNTWAKAILAYESQLSTFWSDEDSVLSDVNEWHEEWGGIPILLSRS